MRHEIRRIEPLRLANVLGLVYGIFTLVAAILFAAFHAWMPMGAMAGHRPHPGLLRVALVFYPIVGAAWGWLGGLVGAALYNLVARWIGGIQVELTAPPPVEPPAGGARD